jgi:sugar/nucleoside kinase (ribokinase family)
MGGMSMSSERPEAPSRPGAPRAGRAVAGRRRGAGKRFLVVGHDPAAVIRHRPTGAAGNTATWLGWLGAEVDLVARVGVDDVYRHERALADAGVRAHIRYDARSATGAVVSVRNGDRRTAMSDPAASGVLSEDDLPPDLTGRADIVHLTGAAMLGGGGAARIASLVERAHTGPARVALDPSSTAIVHAIGAAEFLEALEGVDVLFPSEQEALALTGTSSVAAAMPLLTARVPLVVVTMGHDGVLLGRPGRSPQRVPITPATVVDTLGAGDAFAAGFLRAWATDPVRVGAAAREGTRVAARALGFVGGRPPV